MRIAVMADIHGNHIALEACLAEAKRRGAEEYLFLGDYLGDLPYPQRTLARLEEVCQAHPCTFIRGNKEEYWIDHLNGRHADWVWSDGSSSTGMLKYDYDRLTEEQILRFAAMPIAKEMRYPGCPAFTICHGSPWKVNQSLREDYPYIDEAAQRLETELTVCAHFHIQCKYVRRGKTVVNPGSVGVPLRSGGRTQFLLLSDIRGQWREEFITLPYDVDAVIREMEEERLLEQAPGWSRVTRHMLPGGPVTHMEALARASALCARHTGKTEWKNIPETYWNMALEELGVP